MNSLFINTFFVGFMISEIPRVYVFDYFPHNTLLSFDSNNLLVMLNVYVGSVIGL